MGDDWIGKLITGVVTLLGGWLLWQLQQGGVRRRRRREIREELELLGLLNDHPQTQGRMRKRLEVLLEQYEPDPRVVLYRRLLMLLNAFALAAFAFCLWTIVNALREGDVGLWDSVFIGGASAVIVALINWFGLRSKDVREQDRAVASVELGGTLPQVQGDFRMSTSPTDP
ncbi:hypothetical protein [Nocardioides sp. LHG3406-4]|uniref:hypothetical protein n=1 Tax=Nocardioides sp. LHG3406-4 TaxID=2804575 RepID=UPI003CEF062C